jgi:hypothetical protein
MISIKDYYKIFFSRNHWFPLRRYEKFKTLCFKWLPARDWKNPCSAIKHTIPVLRCVNWWSRYCWFSSKYFSWVMVWKQHYSPKKLTVAPGRSKMYDPWSYTSIFTNSNDALSILFLRFWKFRFFGALKIFKFFKKFIRNFPRQRGKFSI